MEPGETTEEFEERIIKNIATKCPLMRKCLQLETMHQALLVQGCSLDKMDEKFRKEYIVLAQSVYDDFGLDIKHMNYTARRWRLIVMERNSDLLLNMRTYCDTSKVNFLGIRCSNLFAHELC